MSNVFNLPRYIGICGNPKAGKSLLQEILLNNYGAVPVDDGGPLRDIAVKYLGLTREQVSTQAGKAEYVEILGRRWQVREILGEVGNRFEAMFGEEIMPLMATRELPADGIYSFGSVRNTQSTFYKREGGIIIGVRNPEAPPSPYAFDKFDESLIDVWIDNDALSCGMDPFEARKDLEAKLHQAIIDLSRAKAA